MKEKIIFIILIALIVVDVLTTFMALRKGLIESNALFSHFNKYGISWLDLLGKIGFSLLLCGVSAYALKIAKGKEKIPFYFILIAVTVFYIYVVTNNLIVLSMVK